MPKIFISYRRADSRKDAGRIYDRLVDAFGRKNVFKDVDNIPPGRDFRGVLSEAVNACDVLLVVIGQNWLTIADEQGNRRVDSPADFVRIEIQSGLQREDAGCLVIPVLVDNATMAGAEHLPMELRELAFKNAITVRDDPDFHRDMERLVKQLHDYDEELEQRRDSEYGEKVRQRRTDPPAIMPLSDERTAVSKSSPRRSGHRFLGLTTSTTVVVAIGIFTLIVIAISLYVTATKLGRLTVILPSAPTIETRTAVTSNADWTTVEQDVNGVRMVQVPPGCFVMGNEPDTRFWDGIGWVQGVPAGGQICFDKSFWLDKSEVTNAQFMQFNGQAAQTSRWTGRNRPRENVTWFEAHDFCALRGGRLPTEAEWEYAVRGPDNLAFPWGNDFVPDNVVFSGNSNDQTADVGSKPSGRAWVGALDMSGNVWEWVLTLYNTYPYPTPGSDFELEQWVNRNDTKNKRSLRGGAWGNPTGDVHETPPYAALKAASRNSFDPTYKDDYLGFRCVVSAPS